MTTLLVEFFEQSTQFVELGAGDAASGRAHHVAFEGDAHLDEVIEARIVSSWRIVASTTSIEEIPLVRLGDRRPVTLPRPGQAHLFEDLDRLADDRAADAERDEQRGLGRKRGAGRSAPPTIWSTSAATTGMPRRAGRRGQAGFGSSSTLTAFALALDGGGLLSLCHGKSHAAASCVRERSVVADESGGRELPPQRQGRLAGVQVAVADDLLGRARTDAGTDHGGVS